MNAVTKKDRYPLPHIQDIFDTVGCGKIFTTLDMKSGYWQLPVAEADREKTAFVCHRGSFNTIGSVLGWPTHRRSSKE